ncbi:MAG: phosphoribosylanthranilate isomerase [Eubacteriales bacterium]
MKIKICGINNFEDLQSCIKAGADALGFLVGLTHPAEDKLEDIRLAKSLIDRIPPFVSTVMVTHLTNEGEIVNLARCMGTTSVQINDYTEPSVLKKVCDGLKDIKIIKSVHVTGSDAIELTKAYLPFADAILLDSREGPRIGGTGKTHDWEISRKIVQESNKPVILAGGLNPGNVYEAVKKVQPFAVDVNSGVETNFRKDPAKINLFINEARRAFVT